MSLLGLQDKDLHIEPTLAELKRWDMSFLPHGVKVIRTIKCIKPQARKMCLKVITELKKRGPNF